MKKIKKLSITLLLTFYFTLLTFSQTPNQFKYQAVLRDANGTIMANQTVTVAIDILQGSAIGSSVFTETHNLTTTAQGIINLNIGSVNDMSNVDFSDGTYFVQIAVNGNIMGTGQLLSVPYAIHAKTAENVFSGNYNDLSNQPSLFDGDYNSLTNTPPLFDGQWSSLTGTPTTIAGYGITDAFDGNYNSLSNTPSLFDGQWSSLTGTAPDISTFSNDSGYLTTEADGSTTNEIQNLSYTASTRELAIDGTNSTDVTLPLATTIDAGLLSASDKTKLDGLLSGTQTGDMQYWNGTAWVVIPTTPNEGATLQMIGGVPTWTGGTPPPPSVTNPITGRIWMDRNLGASQVATSSNDANAYGDLYQWGRAADGHQLRSSGTIITQATSDTPGHSNFIGGYDDWRNPSNDNLWQGVNGINNPCPTGYRIPTSAEWQNELNSWDWSINHPIIVAFLSPLKLTVGGFRNNDTSFYGDGLQGNYWSSTVYSSNSIALLFDDTYAFTDQFPRANGSSVRCIKD